jgi:hypothetical protein
MVRQLKHLMERAGREAKLPHRRLDQGVTGLIQLAIFAHIGWAASRVGIRD